MRRTRSPRDQVAIWNAIADDRFAQISSGRDKTYTKIIIPTIENLIRKNIKIGGTILDYGCGSGYLSKILAPNYIYTGADISDKSIEVARANFSQHGDFKHIGETDQEIGNYPYDCVLSCMVLMDAENLQGYLDRAYKLTTNGGYFIFSTIHPCFWSSYWGYSSNDWFQYGEEFAIERKFTTSTAGELDHKTVHFHRPLSTLLNSLTLAGFSRILLQESDLNSVHKGLNKFKFPKFLFGVAQAQIIA